MIQSPELENFKKHPAYQYAVAVSNRKIPANEYIIIAANQFIEELNDPDSKYYFDFKMVEKIGMMSQFIMMPSGLSVGKPVGNSLVGFQWFFVVNALCWKMEDNHMKRRYEKSVLLIGRKSGKTFLVAFIFILLLLLEPRFSNFYSVAPDRELSSLILEEIKHQIAVSPLIEKHFKVKSDEIQCTINDNKFTPLATSNNRMDGRLAAVFVADEVGALRNRYPIDAMESSQMNVVNRTGILISTAYDSLDNPMTQEVKVAQKVLKGEATDDTLFAMIYKPDKPNDWMTSDDELLKANPLAIDIPETKDFLIKQREKAINNPERRGNFLTKHMNIFINGEEAGKFISNEDLEGAELEPNSIDWRGKEVYVGLDLAQSGDNTAVAMTHYDRDTNNVEAAAWVFYPAQREAEKKRLENIDYTYYSSIGLSFPTGGKVIDYEDVENFVFELERKYGVIIKGIGYDKYNAASSIGKFENYGYDCFRVVQNAMGLYPGTKFLKESILSEHFHFEKNYLLRTNLLNARTVTNTNMMYFLNKKESDGKIDAAAAIVDSMALWRDEIDNDSYDGGGIIVI